MMFALAAHACGSNDAPSEVSPKTETSVLAGPSLPQSEHPANVVLISIDTLRADHVGCYGAAGDPTPNIDRIAREGVRFNRAYANVPVTTPSHATILTGTFPLFHGVRSNGTHTLPPSSVTLAEMFHDAGYATAGIIGAYPLNRSFGVDQGFDHFDDSIEEDEESLTSFSAERSAGEVINRAIDWLDRRNREQPFFLFVHVYDPHHPYRPPEPFSNQWLEDPYRGEIAYTDAQLGRLFSALENDKNADPTLIAILSDHGEGLGEHNEQTHTVFVYDSTLHVPLILRGPGIPPGHVVETPVQLVDVTPTLASRANLSIPQEIQGNDLSLLLNDDTLPKEIIFYAETMLPQIQYDWAPLESVRDGSWKYIQAPISELYDLDSDPREIKNLWGQEPDVQVRMQELLRRAHAQLSGSASDAAIVSVDADTAKKLAALGYIGAFDADVDQAIDPMSLPDPKERIGIFNQIEHTFTLISQGRQIEAREIFREMFANYPEEKWLIPIVVRSLMTSQQFAEVVSFLSLEAIKDLPFESRIHTHGLRACAYEELTMWPEALREWQIVDRNQNNFEDIVVQNGLGKAHVKLGNWKQAVEHLEQAKAIDDSDIETRLLLSQALLGHGNELEALANLHAWRDLVANDDPGKVDNNNEPLFRAARFYLELGREKDAARLLKDLVESSPANVSEEARYLLSSLAGSAESLDSMQLIRSGHARGNRGDWAGAAKDLKAAIEGGADSYLVHYDLALCLINLGKWKHAHNALVDSIKRKNDFPPALTDFGFVQESIGEVGHMRVAEAHYRRAISLQPDFYPAQTRLGSLLLRQGGIADAIIVLEQATRSQPQNPIAYSHLALAYEKAGRTEDANKAQAIAQSLK
ncbi:MAG: sulfatase-like hydrolase/transferase [bacterium]|nr:sulfatase-like hydrolase/transferase [bacterium]